MLSPPVPCASRDPGAAARPSHDGAAEDPFPRPSRPVRPRPAPGPVARGSLATACLLGDVAALPTQNLPTVSVAATISPVHALVAIAAAAVAGFGAMATAGLIGYSPTRLAQYLDERRHPDREALTAELATLDSEYAIVAAAYTALGWVAGLWALQRAFDDHSLPWALALWLALMLLVAGSLPVAAAETRAERTVLLVRPVLRAGWVPLRWLLVKWVLAITNLVVHVLRLERAAKADAAEVQKQVLAAVADTVTGNPLADAERTWIGNIVALKDLQVSTVMTPRPDIVALPDTMTLREAVDQALEHEFSRYPVYHDRIDEVVGIFYVKDALRLLQSDPVKLDTTPLRSLLREPLFVPETTGAAQLLRRVQAGNQHMAIVIDEYGTTVGLATVEDLVEEIVGEIGDEYDSPPSELADAEQIRVVEAGRVLELPARSSVSDVNRLLGSHLREDGDWETVAGLVIATCNRIPAVGETVVVDDVEFRVLAADDRRVQRLRVTALFPQTAEGGG